MIFLAKVLLAFIASVNSQSKSCVYHPVGSITESWEVKLTDGEGRSTKAFVLVKGENGSFKTSDGHYGDLNCIRSTSNGVAGRWISGGRVGRFEVQILNGGATMEGWLLHKGKKVAKISGIKR